MSFLPFRRRKSRWERLRETMTNPEKLRRELRRAERLRVHVPDREAVMERVQPVAGRVQPVVRRVASARRDFELPDLHLSEAPAFLQERLPLDRLPSLRRRPPSRREQLLNAEVPLWAMLAAGLAGFAIGYSLRVTVKAGPSLSPSQLEAASDQIKTEWPEVEDEDIREARGNLKKLSGVIGERTGEPARSVRERLATMTAQSHSSNGNTNA